MKRKNIERVLVAHLPDRWMTAGAIIDYIHNLPGTLGINGIQKAFHFLPLRIHSHRKFEVQRCSISAIRTRTTRGRFSNIA